jgi:hypothetical protein
VVSLTVLVDPETLDTRTSPATGKIHVRFGDVAFPDTDWDDFVVVVLGWWLEEIRNLIWGGSGAQMWFMDGPFIVTLEPIPQVDRWRATAKFSGATSTAPYGEFPVGVEISPGELIASLARAARTVLTECNRRGVNSLDVQNLAAGLDALVKAEAYVK